MAQVSKQKPVYILSEAEQIVFISSIFIECVVQDSVTGKLTWREISLSEDPKAKRRKRHGTA